MPTLSDLRAKLPSLEGLNDEQALSYLQQRYAPDIPASQIARNLGLSSAAPEAPLPERNTFAAVNDTVIDAANAVASGVGAIADFAAPGNAISPWIDANIVKPGKQSQSDRKQVIDARLSQELDQAEGVGDELAAVGRYAASDPLGILGQAAGSFAIPGFAVKGAGMLAKTVGLGGRAAGAGMAGGAAAGAALSGGDAAGQAYEESLKAGATEEQAQAAARQASMIPAVVGAAGGMFGAERLLAGGRGFAGGAASRAIKAGLSEGAQEAIEEGVTQFEANRAVMPFDGRDPTKGVAAAGMLGALMGGPTGAAVAAITPQAPEAAKPRKPSLAEGLTKIAEAPDADTAIKAMADALDPKAGGGPEAQTGGGLDRLRSILPDEQRREVLGLMATAGNPNSPPNVRQYAESRIDAILREYTEIPTAEVVEETELLPTGDARELTDAERADYAQRRRLSDERQIVRGIPTGEATEALPTGEATEVEPIPAGEAVEDIPAGDAAEMLPTGEATELIPTGDVIEEPARKIPTGKATEIEPEVIEAQDLLTGDGMPYGSKAGALVRAKREGLTPGNVVEIPGAGWVVRPVIEARPAGTRGTTAADVLPKETPREPVVDMAGTAGEPVAAGAGRAPDADGSGLAVGRVATDPGRGEPDAAGTPVAGGAEAAPVGDGGGADAALTGETREQAIRREWSSKPRTIGRWEPITVSVGDRKNDMLALQRKTRSDGKGDSPIIMRVIRQGRIMNGGPVETLLYTFRLTGANEVKQEGIARKPTDAEVSEWKAAGFALPGETSPATQPQPATPAATPPASPVTGEGETTRAAPKTAADWSNEMDRLRKNKPRPLDKLYGKQGQTPEQAAAHAEQMRAWNREYRKASAEQKQALQRDNEAFRAREKAAPAPEAAPAEPAQPAPAAAPAEAQQATPARYDKPKIELRKRLSVLRSLKECLG